MIFDWDLASNLSELDPLALKGAIQVEDGDRGEGDDGDEDQNRVRAERRSDQKARRRRVTAGAGEVPAVPEGAETAGEGPEGVGTANEVSANRSRVRSA